MDTILDVKNITKDFIPPISLSGILQRASAQSPATHALADVSFTLERGRILAILGPNGAGKTTLLKILSTLILPDSGTVNINGFFLNKDDNKIKASIGLITSAERSFYWRLTGRQNLQFFAALYGLSISKSRARLKDLFELFEIDYQDRRFDGYSTGMQQKFALMRALLHDPEILFLDEPTKSLDYGTASSLRSLIKDELVKKRKKTIIFTTHHMEEALDFADIFMILHKGKVLGLGTLEELRQSSGLLTSSLGEIFITLTKGS